jgi:hypothetical protein
MTRDVLGTRRSQFCHAFIPVRLAYQIVGWATPALLIVFGRSCQRATEAVQQVGPGVSHDEAAIYPRRVRQLCPSWSTWWMPHKPRELRDIRIKGSNTSTRRSTLARASCLRPIGQASPACVRREWSASQRDRRNAAAARWNERVQLRASRRRQGDPDRVGRTRHVVGAAQT